MGSVCFSYYFGGGSTSGLMLIGWHTANMSSTEHDLAWILFQCDKYDRKSNSKTSEKAQTSGVPLKELSHVKLRRLTTEHISNNTPKSSKIHDYTH